MPDTVQTQVEGLRRKLLDLSLRNRMLNFRPSKRLGVAIVGEDSLHVHRLLVEDERKLTFTGRPDPPTTPADPRESTFADAFDDPVSQAEFHRQAADELTAYLDEPAVPLRLLDSRLDTEEFESELQAKLRLIHREANLSREELGVDTLFLTLGMLQWREPNAERSYRAPLLFVPVMLERHANGSMRLTHAGGDVGQNQPLRAKLLELNLSLPLLDEDPDLPTFFDSVRAVVRPRADWAVHPHEIALGFFNYEKFAMYVDLGGASWPDDRKPWAHPDVVALLGQGYPPAESPITDDTPLDPVRPADRSLEVYDADSSQTLAMLRAAEGLSLVVEGPPGTGKSQTITNIIAEAVAAGKRVLFVSAKRAALGVVKRRLEEAGLGALCLDLHDKLTNRREFYAELKRTADLALNLGDDGERLARWDELRTHLNAHAEAVNAVLPRFQCTPFQAMIQLAALGPEDARDREGRIPFEHLSGWTEADLRRHLPLIDALQARLPEVGVPEQSPFWGARLTHLDPALRLDLEEDLRVAGGLLARAEASVATAASALGIPAPQAFDDLPVLRSCAQRALEAPPLGGVAVRADTWSADAPLVRGALASLARLQAIRARRVGHVSPGAWDLPWEAHAREYEAHCLEWYGVLFGGFRAARRALRAALTDTGPREPAAQRDLLRDLVQAHTDRATVHTASPTLTRLFGPQWRAEGSDPAALGRVLEWMLALHGDVAAGRLPPGVLDFFAGTRDATVFLPAVETAEREAAAAGAALRVVLDHLQIPEPTTIARARGQVEAWRAGLPQLPAFIAYAGTRSQALERGLAGVVERADGWEPARERLRTVCLRSYYLGVMREAVEQRPALRHFEREEHQRLISEFRSLDDFKLAHNRARVRVAHSRRLPSFAAASGNLLLLRQQCELTRRHRPIRWCMARAGEAVMHIKPVFMMSPLSVAIHLPPEMPAFDLVIFDEASQVKPEDALCAIMRGRQTIVVGDTRQMPPTSFFDRVTEDTDLDEEPDDEAAELAAGARSMESVLSLMSSVALGRVRRPDLRWHYRSLHPALIQPSNEMFYENRLIVFPSATGEADGKRIGVVLRYLEEGRYESGRGRRVNPREAVAVADAVVQRLRERPEESLLVAAMNRPQADLIWNLLQLRERQDPDLFAHFRARHPHEPLDARNLENVQGDERDVVFISVTYGRDASGVLQQRFGPLLTEGGERRLNVLVTRARVRCEVFSSLRSSDLRTDPPRPGVVCLQRYLRYAETGLLDHVAPTGAPPESPFEEDVAAALRDHGYEADAQVGSEGYRIDLAVRDPRHPGRYVLGVECDGAAYHSARSARDRDKLRQRVLEHRGWRLHRIWSMDWWQDADAETRRLLAALEAAVEADPEAPPPAAPAEEPPAPMDVEVVAGPPRRASFAPYPAPPLMTEGESVAAYCLRVVGTEGPIQAELLLTRLRTALGYGRLGAQIRPWLEGEIADLTATGAIRRQGDAYYTDPAQLTQPRDWSTRPTAERRPHCVSEPEIAAALRLTVSEAFGIPPEEGVREAFVRLGFARVTEPTRSRGGEVLKTMLQKGELRLVEGLLRPAESAVNPARRD